MHIADVIKIKYDISPDAPFKCIIRDSSNDLSVPLIETSRCAKLSVYASNKEASHVIFFIFRFIFLHVFLLCNIYKHTDIWK